jgi:hypothetical protein
LDPRNHGVVVWDMTSGSSLWEMCHDRFARYRIATKTADRSGTVRTMILMLRRDDGPQFFVLSQDCRDDRPRYSLRVRRSSDSVDIEAKSSAGIPDAVVEAVSHGVPIPRDGSLFGWRSQGTVATLVPVYTAFRPQSPDPFCAVMPRVGTEEARWPPFTDERPFGPWFWQHYAMEEIISLDSLIAETPGTVFWADTKPILGSHCCAIARDIKSPGGCTLQRGVYAYFRALRTGEPVPSLGALLASSNKTDLAPRFQRSVRSAGSLPGAC